MTYGDVMRRERRNTDDSHLGFVVQAGSAQLRDSSLECDWRSDLVHFASVELTPARSIVGAILDHLQLPQHKTVGQHVCGHGAFLEP